MPTFSRSISPLF